jgi:hypothetical protein
VRKRKLKSGNQNKSEFTPSNPENGDVTFGSRECADPWYRFTGLYRERRSGAMRQGTSVVLQLGQPILTVSQAGQWIPEKWLNQVLIK